MCQILSSLLANVCRCSGLYKLVVYQARLKPNWIRRTNTDYTRYGHIEGIDADKIAYAMQASEAAFILVNPGEEVMVAIMKGKDEYTDENLYIGFTNEGAAQLKKIFPDLRSGSKTYDQVKVEFEVKHMFFNNLVKSVNGIAPIIVQRLLPQPQDFLTKSSDYFQYKHYMHALVSQLDSDDQLNALKKIALCPSQSPPILINGSFGTGKTRVLAIAAYYITEMSKEPARVLVCAHHQASADHFVESYFGEMATNRKYSWRSRFIRLTSFNYNYFCLLYTSDAADE